MRNQRLQETIAIAMDHPLGRHQEHMALAFEHCPATEKGACNVEGIRDDLCARCTPRIPGNGPTDKAKDRKNCHPEACPNPRSVGTVTKTAAIADGFPGT